MMQSPIHDKLLCSPPYVMPLTPQHRPLPHRPMLIYREVRSGSRGVVRRCLIAAAVEQLLADSANTVADNRVGATATHSSQRTPLRAGSHVNSAAGTDPKTCHSRLLSDQVTAEYVV